MLDGKIHGINKNIISARFSRSVWRLSNYPYIKVKGCLSVYNADLPNLYVSPLQCSFSYVLGMLKDILWEGTITLPKEFAP